MENNKSLKKFVYGVLVRRLALASIVIASVFSFISYNQSSDMIISTVIKISNLKIDMFRAHFRQLMEEGKLEPKQALIQAINYPPGTRIKIDEGHYVYAMIYDRKNQHVEAYEDGNYSGLDRVKQYIKKMPVNYPKNGILEHRVVKINKRPYIYVNIRLIDNPEQPPLFLHAVFALSDKAIAKVEQQVIKTILYVIAIVFSTTLLLYPVITHLTGKLSDFSSRQLNANLEMLEVLGTTIAKRDSDTDAHNYRVSIYAIRLAESIGLGNKEMQALIKGSFLHDLGKIGIRDNILLKPGKLDEAEFTIMKNHVKHGLDIIHKSDWLNDAEDIVGGHHEKFNGKGYPRGIVAKSIPITARIFAITDVFDALTSRRPYKEPFSFERTMDILEQSKGTHFDPELVDKFKNIARNLYDEFSGRDDERLKDQLHKLTIHYFHSGIETLNY